ncbi:MAG: hypothetical protein Q3965_02050 [Rothia sp. (in: high G+C Gram-positive bacteria)]|nr:hypothetical protein [Rothia sp. (in: high G+C Gram-positive bacteria)]
MSNGAPERNGTPQYSGTKELGSNIALFVLCFAILLACFYALGTYPDGGWTWWTIAILLYAATFIIPLWILPSKTNEAGFKGGKELHMK